MVRTLSIAFFLLGASAIGAAAQQNASRPLLPAGDIWQSIPYAAEPDTAAGDGRGAAAAAAKSAPRHDAEHPAQARPTKAAIPARPQAQPHGRKPAPASAVPPSPPAETAAARTKELSRRIEALAPGTKLDEPMTDHDNPAWRRRPPDRPGVEGRDFAFPIDDSGKAGFVARSYHQEPAWNNRSGNTGATFSLRQRF